MRVVATGANGYIGGRVAARLVEAGHEVFGVVKPEDGVDYVRARGVTPVAGDLNSPALIDAITDGADAILNLADSDNLEFVEAVLRRWSGSGKVFIHNSGTSIVSDEAIGEVSAATVDDVDFPFPGHRSSPERIRRLNGDRRIVAAGGDRMRTVVICPCMVYGRWNPDHLESTQLRCLIDQARATGIVRYIGNGRNVWSNVHIDDLADLYILALENPNGAGFFFAESGECELKTLAESIDCMLGGQGCARTWALDDATAVWGARAKFGLASNCRVRGTRSRKILNWRPRRASLLDEIRHGSLYEYYRHGARAAGELAC